MAQPIRGPQLDLLGGAPYAKTVIYQNKTSEDSNTATGINLTGWTVNCSAKTVPNDQTPPDPESGADIVFTVTLATPQAGENLGKFTLSLTSTQTGDALETFGQDALFRYDIALIPPSGATILPVFGFVRIYAPISPVTP
jgi:hypothetical protein